MFCNEMLPQFAGLSQTGVSVVCIFIGTLALMLFVEMGWPLLVSILASVYCDVWMLQEAVSASLGNNIVWFIVFSGIVISLLEEAGVIQNIALWFITRPWNKGRPWMFIGSLFLSTFLLGTIMDCTALFLIMVSLVENILRILGYKRGDKFGSLIMIGVMVSELSMI